MCPKCYTMAILSCNVESEALAIEDPCERKNLLRTLLGSSAAQAKLNELLPKSHCGPTSQVEYVIDSLCHLPNMCMFSPPVDPVSRYHSRGDQGFPRPDPDTWEIIKQVFKEGPAEASNMSRPSFTVTRRDSDAAKTRLGHDPSRISHNPPPKDQGWTGRRDGSNPSNSKGTTSKGRTNAKEKGKGQRDGRKGQGSSQASRITKN